MTTAYEEYEAELMERYAAHFAPYSDEQLQATVDRIRAERAVPLYRISTDSGIARRDFTILTQHEAELKRRASVANQKAA